MKTTWRWFIIIIFFIIAVFFFQRKYFIDKCEIGPYCFSDTDCECGNVPQSRFCINHAFLNFYPEGFRPVLSEDMCQVEINIGGSLKCVENYCFLEENNNIDPSKPLPFWFSEYCNNDSNCVMAGAEYKGPDYGYLDCTCIPSRYAHRFGVCQSFGNQTNTVCKCLSKNDSHSKSCQKVIFQP